MANLVFGCGAGRCGTKSLAKLLNQQSGTVITHEGATRLEPEVRWLTWDHTRGYLPPWNPTWDASAMVDELVQQLQAMGRISGDISFAWCRYVGLLEKHGARVICLRRDREETVASFLARRRDHATANPTDHLRPGPLAYLALPKFDTGTREQNARELWTYYYEQAEMAMECFPDAFQIFDMDVALNTEIGQRDMLEWAGFDAPRTHVGIRDR